MWRILIKMNGEWKPIGGLISTENMNKWLANQIRPFVRSIAVVRVEED